MVGLFMKANFPYLDPGQASVCVYSALPSALASWSRFSHTSGGSGNRLASCNSTMFTKDIINAILPTELLLPKSYGGAACDFNQ